MFLACLLAFNIVITPIAAIAGTYKKAPSAKQPESSQANKSAAENVFAQPIEDSLPAAKPEAVPQPLPLVPLGPDITATLTGSLLAANGGIDVDNDGKADPGDTIAYTLTLTSSGLGGTSLSIANPLDPHTTLVPGSLNSTPVAFDQSVSLNEDATLVITLQGQDPDGSNLTFKDSAGNPFPVNPNTIATTHGTIGNFGSVTCDANGVCSQQVTYTPAANYNGSDSFSFKANDGTANSNENGAITITVNSVNDAPTFTVPGNPAAVNEDAGAQTVTNFITGVRPAQNGNTTEDAQTVSFVISNNTNSSLFSAGPTLTVSGATYPKTATLTYTSAANQNGTATITYHAHDDGGTANGGVDNSADQTFTITVNAVNDPPVVVAPSAYSVIANMKVTGLSGLLGNVNDNADNGVNGCVSTTFSVDAATVAATSAQGGNVTLTNANTGTFDYDPPAGFTGTDTFTYKVKDTGCPGPGVDSSAVTVTINVSGPVIWFVDTTLGVAGTGRLSAPFNTLAAATTAMGLSAAQRIFVFSGSTAAVGTTVTLQGNTVGTLAQARVQAQWLIGGGASGTSFDSFFGITPPAQTIARPAINGARPLIKGTVTMKENSTVQGLNIDVSAGATKGMTASGLSAGASGSLLTVQNVNVTSAGGNAVDFSSAQTVEYTSSAGQVNSLASTTGTALKVDTTTIGANNLNFKSIAAGTGTVAGAGPANGIFLNNTGTSGGLIVDGDGANTSQGGNSSGGTISNATGSDGTTNGCAVYLNNTKGVVLRRMTINGTNQNFAVRGTSVTNFTMEFSTITGTNGTNPGGGFEESSISFDGLLGSAAITSCVVEGGFAENLRVLNTSGTLDRLTVTSCAFGFNNTTTGNNTILIASQNGGTVLKATINSSTFKGAHTDWINAHPDTGSTMEMIVGSGGANTFDNTGANASAGALSGGNRIVLSSASGTLSYKIQNNILKGSKGSAIFTRASGITGSGGAEAVLNGRITNNTIGVAATANSGSSEASGIDVEADGGGDHTCLVDNNSVFQYNNHGILMLFGDNTAGTLPGITARTMNIQMTVTNNTVSNPGNLNTNFNGIHLNNGTTSEDPGTAIDDDKFTSCIDIHTNHVIGGGQGATPPNNQDMRLRQRIATTVRLPGYGGANNDNTAVQTFEAGQNNAGGTPSVAAANTVSTGGGGFIGGAVCTQPSIVMYQPEQLKQQLFARFGNPNPPLDGSSSLALLSRADVFSDVLDYRQEASPVQPAQVIVGVNESSLVNPEPLIASVTAEAQPAAAKPSASRLAAARNSVSNLASAIVELIEPTAHAEVVENRVHADVEIRSHHPEVENAFGRFVAANASLAGFKAGASKLNHAGNSKPEARNPELTVTVAPLVPTPIGQFPVNGTGNGQGFTLPAGKTTTIKFKATLNNPPNLSGPTNPKVSAQATITGAFIGNPVVSDDPSVGGTTDPTVTVVDLFDTTTTLAAVPTAGNWNAGQSVTFTATVSPNSPAATGTVVFKDNGTAIGACNGTSGVTVSAGQAQCVVTFSSGAHSVQAFYSGDGNYDPSTSNTLAQGVVNPSATTTAVTSSQNPSVVTQNVTFTATVTSNSGFSGPPTGTVTFKDGGNPMSCTGGNQTLNGGGVATCQKTDLTPGPHTITALYNGDANFTTSTGSLTGNPQVVNQAGPTVTLVSSLNPSLVTQNVTFTGTVTAPGGVSGTPSGTLTFKDGGSPITCTGGNQTLSGGVGTCQISTLSAGSHTITVDYSGDTNFNAVNGTGLTANGGQNGNPQVVNKSNTTTTVSPSPASPAPPATPVVFTATVASQTAVTGPPAGKVTFVDTVDGAITCTGAGESNTNTGETLNGSGQATCTTSTLSTAVHSITATYVGDGSVNGSATFNGSVSAPLSYTVGNPCSNSVVVTSNANSGADTLREAVDTKVCDSGTITFDPGVTSITLLTELHITRPMTITGPGAGTLTISGNNVTRIFNVDNAQTASISGVTLLNGKVTGAAGGAGANGSPAFGGGISNAGTLTLTGVVVSGGQVTGGDGGAGAGVAGGNGGDAQGGGIFNSGSLTLNTSTVSGGVATGGKGGDSDTTTGNGGNALGGGIYNTGTLTLNGSTFSLNTATGGNAGAGAGAAGVPGSGNGGGIYNDATASSDTVTISGSTISGNTAAANGGGIYNIGTLTQATLNINNSTISGNHANNNGGGILNSGDTGTTTLKSVTIFGNDSDHDNDTNGDGGGIDVVSGVVVLQNTIVGGNLKTPGTPVAHDIFGNVDPSSSFNLIGDAASSGGLTGGVNNNLVGFADMTTVLNTTLVNNGGPTQTHALVANSPALESGSSFGLTTDQRGFVRPVNSDAQPPLNSGDDSDIGAYEQQNQPPAPNAPTLDPGSDTGTVGDNITADTSPTFNITGVISGAFVELRRDTSPPSGIAVVASGTAAGSSIQLTDPNATPDGQYVYTARQTVSGAPTSADSGSVTITINTSTPATPATPDLQAGSDSGVSNSDNLTNATAPLFDIGNVTNTFTVELLRDGVVVASGVAAGSTITLTDNTNPPEGAPRNYTARQTNGVTPSGESAPLPVTFDRTPPVAPGIPDLQAASDTFGAGTAGTNSDNITSAATRLFDVTITPEANSTVTLLRNGNPVVGSTVTGDSSPKTLTDADAIADSTYQYTVQHSDAAGNSSVSASPLNVTLDTTVSANTPDLQAASDSFGAGTAGTNSDDITKLTPRSFDITGTENGSNVELLRGGVSIAFTGGTGSTVTLVDADVLPDNQYHYQTRQTDVAGNVQTSGDLIVTIDTTGDPPGTPDLQAGSDAGTSNTDNRTDNATHSFDIASVAGEFVELLRDGVVVSSTTAGGASVTLQDSTSLADGVYHYTARQTDLAGNVATSAGTLDVTIDTTAPSVASVTRLDPTPTAAASVNFTVTFSEPVTGVDATDFVTTNFAGVSGTSVTGVTGSGAVYTVTVNTGSGDGGLRLDVLGDGTIKDVMNLAFNGPTFTSGEVYGVDRSNPSVVSITRAGSTPTNAGAVDFTVTFSEPVNGVDTTDFALTTTGVAGASVSNVAGSGATRTVTVNTGGGDGTIRLDLIDDDSIVDLANKPLGGPGAGNGSFTSGEVYAIDKTAPTVTINQAGSQVDPVTGPSASTIIHFTVVFSEAVTGFTTSSVSFSGTAGATTANITEIAPNNGTTYDVGVQGMTQSGTVIATIPANGAHDAAGNGNTASTSTDNTVTYNIDNFSSFVVNSIADSDDGACSPLGTGPGNQDCTLREAINAANADSGAETITFDGAVFAAPGPYTINLTAALPSISGDLTISGPGAKVLTVKRNTGGNYRIFNITAGNVTIDALTLSNGNTTDPDANGAGILAGTSGTVNITNCTISGNNSVSAVGGGGGIFANGVGVLNIVNTTISGNSASQGGALEALNAAQVNITNSTISGNSATNNGGGILSLSSTITSTGSTITNNRADSDNNGSGVGGGMNVAGGIVALRGTIVAGNFKGAGATADDINGTIDASSSFSLIGNGGAGGLVNGTNNNQVGVVNAGLNALADNGGPTQTHSLQCTSPAIDKGNAFGLTTDQRGGTRPFDLADGVYPNAPGGDGSDIGAYETQTGGGCLPQAIAPPPATTNEDTPVTITLTGQYAQNTNLDFSITATPANGSLGAISAPNCTFTTFMTCTATVQYTPNANFNGSDIFSFRVTTNPGGLQSDPADVHITINSVNDPPTFVNAGNQTVFEDAGPQTVNNFIAIFSPGPPDEAGQTVQFIVTNNTNPGLFSAVPAIDGTGTLTYTPAANLNGIATITIVAKDNGGGNDTSAPQSFTITVVAVNDAPSFTKGADQTVLEDAGAQTVNNFATAISAGPANESGQTVHFNVTNNSNPGLFSAGPLISPTGTLTYTPAANANGTAAITVNLQDDGGVLNGGADTSAPQTFNINVTAVNDVPTFTVGPNVIVNEDAGAQTVNGWATNISAGPADESGQALNFIVSNNNNALFSAQPAISPTGTLTFTSAADANGVATVTVKLHDNGGTANGGVDTSTPVTFTITVNAVNDAPVNTVPGAQTVNENGTLTFSTGNGNAISVSDVDANGNAERVTLTATNGVITLSTTAGLAFTVGNGTANPTMTFTGTLASINAALQGMTFVPASGFTGAASLQIVTNDQGNTGSGGPLTDTDTVNITVNAGGALQFSAATYTVAENNGPAVITITRTGGASGAASVKIDTSNGTATAGSDYTTVSQTVNFADGEVSKTVNVPITDDLLNEPDETVNLTLSNAGGSATLGSQTTAVLTITDNDPVGGYVKFSAPNYNVNEGGVATITVQRVGTLTQAISVDYATNDDSDPALMVLCKPTPGNTLASSRCDFDSAFGHLTWAAGDGADKTFKVLTTQDSYVEGPETVTLTLSNLTAGAAFSGPSTELLTINDDAVEPPGNPVDDSNAYVEQLYRDFLNRPSDPSGKAFWVNNIDHCNDPAQRPPAQTAAQCIEISRIVTAGAFFLSIEFQATGGTAYLTNKVAYGGLPKFIRFESDAQKIGQNYVFGAPGAEAILEANKVAYYNEYVTRTEFVNTYGGISDQQYVNTLISNTGVSFTQQERDALNNGLANHTETRATVLRKISEKPEFRAAEFNSMFVLMEYFGFLRRNPDQAGFSFWLNKLNSFNGDYFAAEMVKAFIESMEYRQRFGTP